MHFYLNKLAGKNGRVDLVLNHEQILKQKAAAGSTNQSSHMITVCDDDMINQGSRGLEASSNPLENTVECDNPQAEIRGVVSGRAITDLGLPCSIANSNRSDSSTRPHGLGLDNFPSESAIWVSSWCEGKLWIPLLFLLMWDEVTLNPYPNP
jgi:hypothetical protein